MRLIFERRQGLCREAFKDNRFLFSSLIFFDDLYKLIIQVTKLTLRVNNSPSINPTVSKKYENCGHIINHANPAMRNLIWSGGKKWRDDEAWLNWLTVWPQGIFERSLHIFHVNFSWIHIRFKNVFYSFFLWNNITNFLYLFSDFLRDKSTILLLCDQ